WAAPGGSSGGARRPGLQPVARALCSRLARRPYWPRHRQLRSPGGAASRPAAPALSDYGTL
ncbi:MAG TPA: hypothetical protein VIL38_05275, partial [Thermaerobacter sp.]